MPNSAVKHTLWIAIAFILAVPVTSFAEITANAEISAADPSSDVDISSMNIHDLTVRETMRYARELYRKGDYAQAVTVFQSILKNDCPNRLAQYHLQKIAQSGPEFTYLSDYLKKLPCEHYNFKEDDFLPAAYYLDTDNDLLLEQLTAYNKRYRNNKTTLAAKISEYNAIAEQLERRTREMTDTLNTSRKMSAETIAELKTSLNCAKNDARSMNDQVAELKKALAQAAIEKNRTVEYRKPGLSSLEKDIATHKDAVIAALKEGFANSKTGTAGPVAIAGSQPAIPVPAAPLAAASSAAGNLTTLQEKFADIQKRLRQIEASIAEKNRRVINLQENLEAAKQ